MSDANNFDRMLGPRPPLPYQVRATLALRMAFTSAIGFPNLLTHGQHLFQRKLLPLEIGNERQPRMMVNDQAGVEAPAIEGNTSFNPCTTVVLLFLRWHGTSPVRAGSERGNGQAP